MYIWLFFLNNMYPLLVSTLSLATAFEVSLTHSDVADVAEAVATLAAKKEATFAAFSALPKSRPPQPQCLSSVLPL